MILQSELRPSDGKYAESQRRIVSNTEAKNMIMFTPHNRLSFAVAKSPFGCASNFAKVDIH